MTPFLFFSTFFVCSQIVTTRLPIEHRAETFAAFPRRSHLHISIARSIPLLNWGAMSFLLPSHNHTLFVTIELLSLMTLYSGLTWHV